MSKTRIDRRHFLRGAAGMVIALPLLEAMGCKSDSASGEPTDLGPPDQAPAAAQGTAKRFIATFIPNGVLASQWFAPDQPGMPRETPLSAALVGSNLQPLVDQDLLKHLILFRGLSYTAIQRGNQNKVHHGGMFTLLTGRDVITTGNDIAAGGPSLDQHVAASIGRSTKVRSLAMSGTGGMVISWRGAQDALPTNGNPIDVFRQLFGDPNADPQKLMQQLVRRQSILDQIKPDLTALSQKVSQADRHRVESHLDSIRDLEARIGIMGRCAPPADPRFRTGFPGLSMMQDWMQIMIDLTVLAMQCDLTRVATLFTHRSGGGCCYYPWLSGLSDNPNNNPMVYSANEHHELSHLPANVSAPEKLNTLKRWHLTQLAYLIKKLRDTPDGAGSLLDTTLVLQGSDHGEGHTHSWTDIPFILAGSAGGAFRTGRYLDLRSGGGLSHNRLLLAIMNALGIPGNGFGAEPDRQDGALDLT